MHAHSIFPGHEAPRCRPFADALVGYAANSAALTHPFEAQVILQERTRRSLAFQLSNGEADQLRGALEAQFFLEAGTMGFDGLDAAVELFGDLAGAKAEPQQVQDLELAFAQPGDDGAGEVTAWRGQPS